MSETWPLASVGRTSFEGKTAVITGASQGIGAAAAIGLARLGANVVCVARRTDLLDKVVSDIRAEGGAAVAVTADVAVEDDVARMVAVAVETYGGLDLAFNNAGISSSGKIADVDVEQFDAVIGVNLRGAFFCMKHEVRAMLARGAGAIVNCASAAGHMGRAGRPIYAASKWYHPGRHRHRCWPQAFLGSSRFCAPIRSTASAAPRSRPARRSGFSRTPRRS